MKKLLILLLISAQVQAQTPIHKDSVTNLVQFSGNAYVTALLSASIQTLLNAKADKKSLDSLANVVKNIPVGKNGADGKQGIQGIQGVQGPQGIPGKDGKDGTGGTGAIAFPYSMISVKDFGANGNGQFDNSKAFDSAINFCIKNNIRTLYIPVGRFRITRPINIINGNAFVTLNIIGESSWWDSNNGSTIVADFNTGPAINIQRGKGCSIRNMKVIGKYRPPNVSLDKFYNLTLAEFADGVVSTSYEQPQCGIAIDYYDNQDGGNGGSSGCIVSNCMITNFWIGIVTSANTRTQNAESMQFEFINFENCATGFRGTQSQEKMNTVYKVNNWGVGFQCFEIGSANWNVSDVNIAGQMVQFGHIQMGGWNSCSFAHVFAETMGSMGYAGSHGTNVSFTDIHCDFNYPEIAGMKEIIKTEGRGVSFTNCCFRFYGNTTPMLINSNAIFNHCMFSGQPYNIYGEPAIMDRCYMDGYIGQSLPLATETVNLYGLRIYNGGESLVSVKVVNHSFQFTTAHPQNYYVNQFVQLEAGNPVGYGVVKEINGNTVTVCDLTNFPDGNYAVVIFKVIEPHIVY